MPDSGRGNGDRTRLSGRRLGSFTAPAVASWTSSTLAYPPACRHRHSSISPTGRDVAPLKRSSIHTSGYNSPPGRGRGQPTPAPYMVRLPTHANMPDTGSRPASIVKIRTPLGRSSHARRGAGGHLRGATPKRARRGHDGREDNRGLRKTGRRAWQRNGGRSRRLRGALRSHGSSTPAALGLAPAGAVLVRPDGHEVARWSAPNADPEPGVAWLST